MPYNDSIENLVKELAQHRLQADAQHKNLIKYIARLEASQKVRENWHGEISFNTASTGVQVFDIQNQTGLIGESCNSAILQSLPTGAIVTVRINGTGNFLPVTQGQGFQDEVIRRLEVNVTTSATGTALIRLGAFVAGVTY